MYIINLYVIKYFNSMREKWLMHTAYTIVCPLVLVSLGYQSKTPQARLLKQHSSIFSQFWELEVQDQVASRFNFYQGLSPWLLQIAVFSLCPHADFSLCTKIPAISSSLYKDTCTSFRLTASLQALFPDPAARRASALTHGSGVGAVQPITPPTKVKLDP